MTRPDSADRPDRSAARLSLGPVGAFLPVNPGGSPTMDEQRVAVHRLEAAGFSSAWTNETVGKDALVQVAILLAATDSMTFGTCIANMWARPAQTVASGASELVEAYPGRFVLGLGVGYAQQASSVGLDFGKPLASARAYLEQVRVDCPVILGAMGPKMLALAGELTDGALPAGVDPEFTASARALLGPDKLLVVYVDAGAGPVAGAVGSIREHQDAGADHVIAGAAMGSDFTAHVRRLEQLAPALSAGRN